MIISLVPRTAEIARAQSSNRGYFPGYCGRAGRRGGVGQGGRERPAGQVRGGAFRRARVLRPASGGLSVALKRWIKLSTLPACHRFGPVLRPAVWDLPFGRWRMLLWHCFSPPFSAFHRGTAVPVPGQDTQPGQPPAGLPGGCRVHRARAGEALSLTVLTPSLHCPLTPFHRLPPFLVQNNNGTLPLNLGPGGVRRVAVVGPNGG